MAKPVRLRKHLGWLAEAGVLLLLFGIFRLLPLDAASALGGWLGRTIGKRLKWHRVAQHNLQLAFPDWGAAQSEHTLTKMWDNLGRNFAEMPWLGHPKFIARIALNEETIHALNQHKTATAPLLFFGGHFGNWEINTLMGSLRDMPTTMIYRHLNNPYADAIYLKIRRRCGGDLYPKGKQGARALLKTMQQKGNVGLLVDQKQNDGVELSFFGHPANTTTIPAEIALKYKSRFFTARSIRTQGCHFTAEVREIFPDTSGGANALMQQINDTLEGWVRAHPAQWLWVHQRWGKVKI